jgi:hypothetical protein
MCWIATHDAIRDVMYALIQKNGHVVWREWWYALTSRVSLWADLYMTRKDQVFVVDVVVINPMWETMALSVISWPVGAIAELNAITKICKYKGLQEGHHFILMAMEVHCALECDMDCFIKECARFFHDRWSKGHLSLYFCIQFFKTCVSIVLQRALTSITKRKIALAIDVCSRPPLLLNLTICMMVTLEAPWVR